ncbi:hypothetical protein ACNKHU_05660 [Shigella flexneri]
MADNALNIEVIFVGGGVGAGQRVYFKIRDSDPYSPFTHLKKSTATIIVI